MDVKLYDRNIEAGTESLCWSGTLDELLEANPEGMGDDEIEEMRALEPGKSALVGMGFRVVRVDGSPVRLVEEPA